MPVWGPAVVRAPALCLSPAPAVVVGGPGRNHSRAGLGRIVSASLSLGRLPWRLIGLGSSVWGRAGAAVVVGPVLEYGGQLGFYVARVNKVYQNLFAFGKCNFETIFLAATPVWERFYGETFILLGIY